MCTHFHRLCGDRFPVAGEGPDGASCGRGPTGADRALAARRSEGRLSEDRNNATCCRPVDGPGSDPPTRDTRPSSGQSLGIPCRNSGKQSFAGSRGKRPRDICSIRFPSVLVPGCLRTQGCRDDERISVASPRFSPAVGRCNAPAFPGSGSGIGPSAITAAAAISAGIAPAASAAPAVHHHVSGGPVCDDRLRQCRYLGLHQVRQRTDRPEFRGRRQGQGEGDGHLPEKDRRGRGLQGVRIGPRYLRLRHGSGGRGDQGDPCPWTPAGRTWNSG